MKLFFLKNELGAITTANWPINENGVEGLPFEVTEEDSAAVQEGTKDWSIADGVLSTIPSTRKADAEAAIKIQEMAVMAEKARKLELIQKVTAGTATEQEQQEFANLL